ncbi:MAG: hypothetical protein QE283_00200 [Rhodoferax sp.]|nr:hypothetical protein [Rhodoferax sp.]
MKTRFWRCVIVSLLLWALPAQWLALAATLPCTGHAEATVDAGPPHDQTQAHAHAHGAMDAAHADVEVSHSDEPPTAPHSHAPCQCVNAGYCCLSAALLSATMPDLAPRGTSVQFAPLKQAHPKPLLSGPDRPPQPHLT